MTAPAGRTVVVVGADLMATARLDQAAAGAGATLVSRSAAELCDVLASRVADLVVLDLDRGGPDLVAELARCLPQAPTRVVGFFSHVDGPLGDAARAAGCEAFPRGRFWRTLPDILSAG